MNLGVRIKNWSFWVSVSISIVAPVLAYFGLAAADISTWPAFGDILLKAISNPYVIGMALVGIYNTLLDPTTAGIRDSARAMDYTVPGGKDGQ